MTKYGWFYPGIMWEDLRRQESSPITDRLDKLVERHLDAYLNGEYDKHEPEVDSEGYIVAHWTDVQKVPKCLETTDCPF